ncbi:MAG: protein kinase [Polyangiaceae bacterium]
MSAPVREGDVLLGKYRIERVLGEGGMGIVVAATHLQLDERVAIKFLLPAAMKSAEVVGRFDREARSAAKIKSEHVARVIDVGKLENEAPFMVMEYLEGRDLSGLLEKDGPVPIRDAVGYLLEACEAIAEAHAKGIVHRDLKPANLFLANRPDHSVTVKVLDFGISKSVASGTGPDASLTRTSSMMGSPLYMSPEQMHSSKNVDHRSDIWALGCILYELVCGRTPYIADTMPELVAAILTKSPEPMTTFRPDTPPEFDAVVMKALQRDPKDRYANVAELAVAIAPFGSRRGDVSLERIARVLGTELAPHLLASMRPGDPAPPSSVVVSQPNARSAPAAEVALAATGVDTTATTVDGRVGGATAGAWGKGDASAPASRETRSKTPIVVAAVAVAVGLAGALGFTALRGSSDPAGSDGRGTATVPSTIAHDTPPGPSVRPSETASVGAPAATAVTDPAPHDRGADDSRDHGRAHRRTDRPDDDTRAAADHAEVPRRGERRSHGSRRDGGSGRPPSRRAHASAGCPQEQARHATQVRNR